MSRLSGLRSYRVQSKRRRMRGLAPHTRRGPATQVLCLIAVIPILAACSGGSDDGTKRSPDREVARGLEKVVGRPIQDVSCQRIERAGYRCTFSGEYGCEVADPIVRGARVTGIDDSASADAAVCKDGVLRATPAEAWPAEVADALLRAIAEGRWAAVFDPSMRRVSCVRERPWHVTAQYRCAARATPGGTPHIAFVQSEGDRIVALWPVP